MGTTPNFAAMAEAARRQDEQAREAEQARLQEELDLSAGRAYAGFDEVYLSDTLDHQTKLNRFRAVEPILKGQAPVTSTPEAATAPAPPASAGSVPFDYDTLPEEARRIIDLVAANPGRFKIEEFGAVKDKDFTKLRKDFQAPQASDAGDSSSTSPTQKASAPASAKKVDPAKKASDKEPEQAPGEKPSGWARVKTAAKQAAQNAKQ